MTGKSNDLPLVLGRMISLLFQGACAVAGVIVLLVIPFVILMSQDMLSGIGIENDMARIQQSPFSVVAILVLLAAMLSALFLFFGKLRALIWSAGEGDPFIPENARHLNAMAWLLLSVQVLALIVGAIRLYLANLVSNTPQSLDFAVDDLDGLLMVLVLFILARIFRHGAAMREDLDGTV